MELLDELRYLILAVQRDGARLFTALLQPLHVTPAQAEVLRVLADYQPLSLIELGDLLVCEQGSPSRLVNSLVEAALVERVTSPANKRKVILTLTAEGAERASQVKTVEQQLTQSLSTLGDAKELSQLRELLWRLEGEQPAGQALRKRLQTPPKHTAS